MAVVEFSRPPAKEVALELLLDQTEVAVAVHGLLTQIS